MSASTTQFACTTLTQSYGSRPVLNGLTFRVAPGQRVALVGENGSGKTTLLRLLSGDLEPDGGTVSRPSRPALQSQVPAFGDARTVGDALRAARAHGDALVEAVAAAGEALADAPEDPAAAEALTTAIVAADIARAWTAADGVAAMARVLGVAELDPERSLDALSGGQRARLHLVAVLASEPDGLLLDEPTNHLDDATVAVLTDRLRAFPGPIVFASHDRQLIEDVATGVLDLDPVQGEPTVVPGGWSAYRGHHDAARGRWQTAFADQRSAIDAARAGTRTTTRDVAHGRAATDNDKFIRKFKGERVQGVTAARIRRSRREVHALEADQVAKPPPTLHLRADTLTGESPTGVLLSAKDVAVAGRLAPIRLDVPAGARILLTGPNGAGKSTLLGLLDGALSPTSGEVLRQPGTHVARLGQEVPAADPGDTPLTWFAGLVGEGAPDLVDLGLVQPRDLSRPVSELSVGQRRRLALAAVIASAPAVLLLDEPTDHLSLTLVEELETALDASPGAVVVASHDRWLRGRWQGDVVALPVRGGGA